MILTIGDSFTFGDELDDRLTQAWPYLLGKSLNQHVVNLGQSGTCNDSMVRKILAHTTTNYYDLIIVAWTDHNRFECWSDHVNRPITIMPESLANLPWTDDFYRYSYNDNFSLNRWYQQILLLQQYLKSRNLNYLFVLWRCEKSI